MTDYKALYEQQLKENKELNEYLKTAEDKLDEEMLKNEKLLKRLTNNTKLIRRLKKDYVLKTDYEKLENDSLVSHCEHCNMLLSYDDFNISLGVGHRCCEMCFEEKKLKDQADIIKELHEEIKYSTLLTGETIMNVFENEYPLLTDKLADKIAKENAESMSNYLYENMGMTVEHEIKIQDYIEDKENWNLMDRDNPDHPQYHEFCGYCGEVKLGINEHIFIFEHETKEPITTCCECGQDKYVCKELKDEGYTRDQETEDEDN
tara:strand:+ start:59 stop:844 length:786 start_codon:yes stop_codon:yes gene_type:complete